MLSENCYRRLGVQWNPRYPVLFRLKCVGHVFASAVLLPPTQAHPRSIEDECLFTYEHLRISIRHCGRHSVDCNNFPKCSKGNSERALMSSSCNRGNIMKRVKLSARQFCYYFSEPPLSGTQSKNKKKKSRTGRKNKPSPRNREASSKSRNRPLNSAHNSNKKKPAPQQQRSNKPNSSSRTRTRPLRTASPTAAAEQATAQPAATTDQNKQQAQQQQQQQQRRRATTRSEQATSPTATAQNKRQRASSDSTPNSNSKTRTTSKLHQRQSNRPVQQQRTQQQQIAQQGEQRGDWQQRRARSFDTEHRTWQQRGGYNGYRIPDVYFSSYYGSGHSFRVYGLPFMEVGGFPRFQYGGYWFSVVDPYPEFWGDDWYQTDDVYVVYVDNGYYLYDSRYPGRPGVAISISL